MFLSSLHELNNPTNMSLQTEMFPDDPSQQAAAKAEREMRTKHGYFVKECVSALQKMIRRGDEFHAQWWAREVLNHGWHNYLWSRLGLISVEDVGDPNAVVWVESARNSFYREAERRRSREGIEAVKGNGSASLFVYRTVISLCRADKCRAADDFLNWCLLIGDGDKTRHPKIPDCALDCHTIAGRQMKRGYVHFYEDGAQLSPESPHFDHVLENELLEYHRRKEAGKQ